MTRVVVVGAGIWGLAFAWRLQQRLPGAALTVLDANARPGGVIDTVARAGFLVEAGPNAFPDNNPATLSLARELGLEGELVAASDDAARNRFLLLDGRLRRLPNSLGSFLTSDLLSWVAKLELLAERFRPRRRATADESIDSFARRRGGREIARTFADAFVTGIFAGDPKALSAPACLPRLVGWERDHGSVLRGLAAARRQPGRRGGQTWSFRGGMHTLVAALAARLRPPPLLGAAARRLRRDADGWVVEGEGRDRWRADAVVLACPAYRQAELLADLDAALAERVGGIAHNRIAVVALGYRRADVPHALDGFGYLSRGSDGRDVLGAQWCSSIFPGRAPEGMVLLRALCGGWRRGDVVDWPDDRLLAAARGEMAVAVGARAAPVFHHIVRWPRAIPQYALGHLDRVAWIRERAARYPGLHLGGSAYQGVAVNDCVEQAGQAAGLIG